LYRSPNTVRVIKSRLLRWVGHEFRMEEDRSVFKILTRYTYRKETFRKALDVGGRTILEWILNK
jgi:hypothetical protein